MSRVFKASASFLIGITAFSSQVNGEVVTPANSKTSGELQFPEIVNTDIPGAPRLGAPQRINGSINEILVEKHGLAYPNMFDWNRDGKRDLLVGEFETGKTGSYIKIFLNEGTDNQPQFTGKYIYATDIEGRKITAYYW